MKKARNIVLNWTELRRAAITAALLTPMYPSVHTGSDTVHFVKLNE